MIFDFFRKRISAIKPLYLRLLFPKISQNVALVGGTFWLIIEKTTRKYYGFTTEIRFREFPKKSQKCTFLRGYPHMACFR